MSSKFFWLLPMVLLAIGCASRNPQTDQFFKSEYKVPVRHEIENVPFILQDVGHCGPATLTMVMQWWNKPVVLEEIVTQVYTPKALGSFQADMVAAVRRNGMLALSISSIDELTREIASNHPVIVFENLGYGWYPMWHYALAFGYDLDRRDLVLHSGKDKGLRESFKVFERSWKLGNYWGLVILPPGELSPVTSELEHVKATSALEQLGKRSEADKSYEAILQRWPQSLGALIGRANIAYSRNQQKKALQYLQRATNFHPQSAAAWHNLAIAQKALNQNTNSRKSAQHALELASESQRKQFEQSLKEIWN